jgi:hypothetical protein
MDQRRENKRYCCIWQSGRLHFTKQCSEYYNQPVLIKNNGTQNITINNIDFSNNSAFTLDELNAYPGITYPIVLAPGDELKYHITFTPIPSMSIVNEFVNVSSDYPTPISIPVSATVIQPPVVTTDSTAIHVILQQSDSVRRIVQLGNTGFGDLDFNLSLDYHRPGIAYNSVIPVIPVKNTLTKKMYSVYTEADKILRCMVAAVPLWVIRQENSQIPSRH